ncbi:MAG: PEP-CTERM-box response regulator transcription factor [Steroidobacteraceae bacterium]
MADNARRLLIVEDDAGLQKQLKWTFEEYEVLQATTREEAIAQLRRYCPPVVLQDLGLPPNEDGVSEGFATLREILSLAPQTKVIVVTGHADRDNAVKAVGLGACDFCQKPLDHDILRLIVERAFHVQSLEEQNRLLLQGPGAATPLAGVIASDDAMLKVCRMVEKVAPTDATVLILGESGTGKELIARGIHDLSRRSKGRFVAINCAAIPENLLESELFGYEKGAFTGAVKTTQGKIELADAGTLFLDEIGDMPAALQAKLLRFLQERVIERVGGREIIAVDVRVVSATNQDLAALIAEKKFREDLYYRISEVPLQLPPLRERAGGAVILARAFLRRFSAQQGIHKRGFAPDAIAAIQAYAWPGNVRELENRIKTAVIMSEGPLVTAGDLRLVAGESDGLNFSLREVRSRAERDAVLQALAVADGNISKAADLLGVSRPTLYDLMDRFGIRRGDEPA